MIRILVLVLAAANLLYFGWSKWVRDDQPRLVAPQLAPGDAPPAAQGATASAPPPCTTLGPAADEIGAMEIEQLLRDMQLVPARRAVTGSVGEGWWVYVANADAAAQARALQAIQDAGISDAFTMPDDPGFRVSVGLFLAEADARSRAEIVRGLSLEAAVQERMERQTLVWFDLPGAARDAVDMERLRAEGIEVQGLRLEDCPDSQEVSLESNLPGAAARPGDGESANR